MRRLLSLLVLPLALLGAACGNDSATGDDAKPSGSTSDDAPLTITDNSGGRVVLDAPATRVVVLEWDFAEHLLAIGMPAVGVADVKGYGTWLASELPGGTTDVGTRQEPSLERIAALDPDLIVGVDFRHLANRAKFEAIAPTLLFNHYPKPGEGSELTAMREAVQTLGKAVGKEEAAEEALDDLDAHLTAAKEKLAKAGKADVKVAIAQGYSTEGTPQIRMFTDNARIVQLLDGAGIDNAWQGPAEQYGYNTVDVEGLTKLGPETTFLYIAQDNDNIFTGAFASNPVWQSLPFVKAGRVRPLGGDTWTWGGPQSAKLFVDRVVSAVIG